MEIHLNIDIFCWFKQYCIYSGQYNVKEELLHKSSTGASASFKSTTERKMTCTPDLGPGPCSYNPYNTRKEKRKGYKFRWVIIWGKKAQSSKILQLRKVVIYWQPNLPPPPNFAPPLPTNQLTTTIPNSSKPVKQYRTNRFFYFRADDSII